MRRVDGLNTDNGVSITIKAQYYKNGFKNICCNGEFGKKGTFACTGVIELDESDTDKYR